MFWVLSSMRLSLCLAQSWQSRGIRAGESSLLVNPSHKGGDRQKTTQAFHTPSIPAMRPEWSEQDQTGKCTCPMVGLQTLQWVAEPSTVPQTDEAMLLKRGGVEISQRQCGAESRTPHLVCWLMVWALETGCLSSSLSLPIH